MMQPASSVSNFYDYQIAQSCRFDSASSSYLAAGFSGNAGQTAYTISFWIKRGNLFTGNDQVIMGNSGGWANWHFDNTDSNLEGVNQKTQDTSAALRDTNGWYNIIINQTATQELGAPAPIPEACSLDDPDCEACQ